MAPWTMHVGILSFTRAWLSGGPNRKGACNVFMKLLNFCPGWVPQLVGALSSMLNGCKFDSWLGHKPRFQVQSLVGEHMGVNQLMFSLSFSLPLLLKSKHVLG